jgi:hypothetical protein
MYSSSRRRRRGAAYRRGHFGVGRIDYPDGATGLLIMGSGFITAATSLFPAPPFPSPCLRTAQSLTANENAVGPLGTRGNM